MTQQEQAHGCNPIELASDLKPSLLTSHGEPCEVPAVRQPCPNADTYDRENLWISFVIIGRIFQEKGCD